jgi:hypothetical protein
MIRTSSSVRLHDTLALVIQQLNARELRILSELYANKHEAEHDTDIGRNLQPVVEFADFHTAFL